MSELGEEMCKYQDHSISGGDNKRNTRQRLFLPEATYLLPLNSTIPGFAMMWKTMPINILTLMNENHEEILRQTRTDVRSVKIIINANIGTHFDPART